MLRTLCLIVAGMVASTSNAHACWWFKCCRSASQQVPTTEKVELRQAVNIVIKNSVPATSIRVDVNGQTVLPNDPFAPTPPPYVDLSVGSNQVNGVFSVGQKLMIYLFRNGQFVGILPETIVPRVERTFDLQTQKWSK